MIQLVFQKKWCNVFPEVKMLYLAFRLHFKFAILMLAAMLYTVIVNAQTNISGKVTDTDGIQLAGVTINVKNKNILTQTNSNGEYKINNVAVNDILVFSYVGFKTQEIVVRQSNTINVSLEELVDKLNEVVVVGYGTQLKKDITGPVSVVDAGALKSRQITTVAEGLQGLASGITVRGGGQPGSEAKITIRGTKTFGNTNPLYVVDGLITTANRDFNPNDIESIQILKDASTTAIYGSRAANGVIIITTKKGKNGPLKIDASIKTSSQTQPYYDLASQEEFVMLNNMAYDNAGVTRQNLDLSVNTDWQGAVFRKGNMKDYNVTLSGGSDNGNYLISGNYITNKGTVISTGFERMGIRVNTSGKKGIFTVGQNLAITDASTDEISGTPFLQVFRMLPTIPIYNPANPGGYGYGDATRANTFGSNPVAMSDLEDRKNQNLRIRGNFFTDVDILKSLKYRFNAGYETSNDHYQYLRKFGNWTLNQPADPSKAEENRAQSSTLLLENTVTFSKDFNKHSITALAGNSFQKDKYALIFGNKSNLLENPQGGYFTSLDQGNTPLTGGYRNETDLISYFSRVQYDYADKYLLSLLVRRDGSSRFGPNNRWKNFPAASVAWRISQEEFFPKTFINDFKVRASYGTVGSNNFTGPYDYIPFINTFSTAIFGRDQHVEQGAIQVRLANTNLTWETNIQTNIGFDLSFLDTKFNLAVDYYKAESKDLLYGAPILLTTGNDGGNPVVNAATLSNKGFEITAGYENRGDKLSYGVNLNLTTINNKVTKLVSDNRPVYVGNTVTQLGGAIGEWYVLETDGIFQSTDEVNNYKNSEGKTIQPGAKPGDIRFKDNNDDGEITNEDKAIVGTPWADFELGFNSNVSYKNFQFSMSWFGSFGATVYNGARSVMERFDDNTNYPAGIRPWTPENPSNSVPRAYYGSTLNSRGDTDRWLEDGSFFRMKYISLGYALPKSVVSKIGVSSALITLSGQNLITLTNYSGLDPEFNNRSIYEKGVDINAWPNIKSYSIGLQIGL